VEDRLGKARSAAVAAIRKCFFMRGLEMLEVTPRFRSAMLESN
jgi:hypothetical protein